MNGQEVLQAILDWWRNSSGGNKFSPMMYGGICDVTVFVIGNGLGDPCSNPRWSCLCFTLHLCLWERHESISSYYSCE